MRFAVANELALGSGSKMPPCANCGDQSRLLVNQGSVALRSWQEASDQQNMAAARKSERRAVQARRRAEARSRGHAQPSKYTNQSVEPEPVPGAK